MSLDGKVMLVTGGSRGIGRAMVLEGVSRGARVAFCARELGADTAEVTAAADAIAPGRTLAVRADVGVEDDVEAFVDATLDRFDRVDIAIHNAGIHRDQLLVRTAVADFDAVIAVNLTGAFLVARRCISEFLAEGDGGRLVFVGSISDAGMTSQTAYAASKGALRGLARTLAKEYGHKQIFTNVVVPGLTDTAMTRDVSDELRALAAAAPMARAGQPAEVARVALHLASARAGFINGEVVYASGGLQELNR